MSRQVTPATTVMKNNSAINHPLHGGRELPWGRAVGR